MVRTVFASVLAGLLGVACMAQTPRTPDIEAQRAAMKKLGFLVGDWSGEASALRGPGQFVEGISAVQTGRTRAGNRRHWPNQS